MLLFRKLRSSSARHKRIDRSFLRMAQAVLVVHSLWSLIVWVSELESVRIGRVVIEGVRSVPVEPLTNSAWEALPQDYFGLSRANTVFLPAETIRERIKSASDRFAAVDLRVDKHTLLVVVEERVPELFWCPGAKEGEALSDFQKNELSDCFFASKDGYIFSAAPLYSGFPFTVYRTTPTTTPWRADNPVGPVGRTILPPDELARTQDLLRALRGENIAPREMIARGDGDYEIMSDQPWSILWSSQLTPKETARRLHLVMFEIEKGAKDPEAVPVSMIDLRFGNKVFYK